MRKIPPKQFALASAQIPTREVHEFKYTFFCLYILVILREWEGREKEQRESMCGCLSCALYWGPCPQPRHVPSLGIKPAIH